VASKAKKAALIVLKAQKVPTKAKASIKVLGKCIVKVLAKEVVVLRVVVTNRSSRVINRL